MDDVHLFIFDFTIHKKGFGVQRIRSAAHAALVHQFGASVPCEYFATQKFAQFLPAPQMIAWTGNVVSLIENRIAQLAQQYRNAKIIIVSYNQHVRQAVQELGKRYGVEVGGLNLTTFAYIYGPQQLEIDWSSTALRSAAAGAASGLPIPTTPKWAPSAISPPNPPPHEPPSLTSDSPPNPSGGGEGQTAQESSDQDAKFKRLREMRRSAQRERSLTRNLSATFFLRTSSRF